MLLFSILYHTRGRLSIQINYKYSLRPRAIIEQLGNPLKSDHQRLFLFRRSHRAVEIGLDVAVETACDDREQYVDYAELPDTRAHGSRADEVLDRDHEKIDVGRLRERIFPESGDAHRLSAGGLDDLQRLEKVAGLAGVGDKDRRVVL